jgi:GDP-4-dehydro-6-deoxy-D-mannose reductase
MRVLVTGIAGFAGQHLARVLLEAGHVVHGLLRRPRDARALERLAGEFGDRLPREGLHVADVLDPRAVRTALAAARPDAVFHLAGVTFVPAAAGDPLAAYRTNFLGTLNVLEGVGEVDARARVVYVGSGDAYGAAGDAATVVTEDTPLAPVSVYAASKAAADLAAFQWGWAGGDVVRVRPFNHTGPGQRPDFVCADFACQVAEIESGRRVPVLEVGNLDAERDFTDVRDIVAGYAAVWERGERGDVYNLCSGRGVRIGTIVEALCRRSRVPIEVRAVAGRQRPREIRRLVGSFAKARLRVGWEPTRPLEQTLDDLLAYFRERVRAASARPG